jgi:hypothetical protein
VRALSALILARVSVVVTRIVLDRALGRMYHPNHFTCQGCGVGLAGQQFKEAGGEPYCGDCKRAVQIVIGAYRHTRPHLR